MMPRWLPIRMMRQADVTLPMVAIAAAFILLGCSGPCDELSGRICASAGAKSPVCSSLQRTVDSAHAGDREACAAGIVYLDELKRGR